MTGTYRLTQALAAHGLAGSRRALPAEPLASDDWTALVQNVMYQRLTGILAWAVADGALATTAIQADQVVERHAEAMATCLQLDAMLIEVTARLADAGVAQRVLKGAAFAHLDYPDPALRCYGDVDLLVRSEQFDRAVAILEGEGWCRRFPQPRPGFDRRFSKGTSFQRAGRGDLDIHRTFVMGPFGLTIDLAGLWSDCTTFRLAGRVLFALPPEERFLHACYHAALGNTPPRLSPLRDMAQMLQRREPSLDIERVRALGAAWRADAVLARAVNLASAAFALEPTSISEWAARHQPDRYERRALATYVDPELGYAARSLAAVRAIPRLQDKASFVWALAFPHRRYVAGRHGGRVQRWRAAAHEFGQVRSRS